MQEAESQSNLTLCDLSVLERKHLIKHLITQLNAKETFSHLKKRANVIPGCTLGKKLVVRIYIWMYVCLLHIL